MGPIPSPTPIPGPNPNPNPTPCVRLGFPLLLALLTTGCERGCLSSWLAERGVGPAPTGATTWAPQLPLSGVDCPEGLARCSSGIVSVSRAFHYSEPCKGPPEQCQCPWERLTDCPRGCAADGVEIDVPRHRAAAQLCAPAPDEIFARSPSLDAKLALCEATYMCTGGTVRACGPPPAAVATCTKGCAVDGQELEEEGVTASAATALLCAR